MYFLPGFLQGLLLSVLSGFISKFVQKLLPGFHLLILPDSFIDSLRVSFSDSLGIYSGILSPEIPSGIFQIHLRNPSGIFPTFVIGFLQSFLTQLLHGFFQNFLLGGFSPSWISRDTFSQNCSEIPKRIFFYGIPSRRPSLIRHWSPS